jgi:ATP-dependent protease Clp ATPase subunit
MATRDLTVLECSFCRRTRNEVSHLIASPRANVCWDCVALLLSAIKSADPAAFDDATEKAHAFADERS